MRDLLRRGVILLVMIGLLPVLSAQTPVLNPTVKVLPAAAGPVPDDCDDVPETKIAERPVISRPPEPQPVRSVEPVAAEVRDLRAQLRAAHEAVLARDRAAFNTAVAAARAMLPSSSAADRALATDVLAAYDDIARLWDYQFNTPSGSFFDGSVQNGSLLQTLTKYPGYETFIQRQTITDSTGTRFYPTRESIEFLAGVAGERMNRGGVRTAAQPPSPAPPSASQTRAQTSTATPPPVKPATATPARPERTEPAKTATNPPATKQTASKQTVAQTERPAPARKTPSRPAKAPASAPIEDVPMDDEAPIAGGIVTSTTESTETAAVPPFETSTALATTFDQVPPPADTVTTATVPEPGQGVQSPPRRRSIILPLVLILIGVGVLIVLFRASS